MSIFINGMQLPKDEVAIIIYSDGDVRTEDWTKYSAIEVPDETQPVKWIPVGEQLPDYNMVVLVTDGEDVGTGYRYALDETGFTGWAVPFADIEEDDVSHWMPLPKPPKDGET